jgi:hypothetical protein
LWGLFLVISLNRVRAEETYHRAGKRDRISARIRCAYRRYSWVAASSFPPRRRRNNV